MLVVGERLERPLLLRVRLEAHPLAVLEHGHEQVGRVGLVGRDRRMGPVERSMEGILEMGNQFLSERLARVPGTRSG